eukprot:scaffold27534_cov21-Phaeocystis_antarctica.AAC.1
MAAPASCAWAHPTPLLPMVVQVSARNPNPNSNPSLNPGLRFGWSLALLGPHPPAGQPQQALPGARPRPGAQVTTLLLTTNGLLLTTNCLLLTAHCLLATTAASRSPNWPPPQITAYYTTEKEHGTAAERGPEVTARPQPEEWLARDEARAAPERRGGAART